jgi:hypothetical protein
VTLETVVDGNRLTLTLLVPTFRLEETDGAEESPCSTLAILTTHQGSFAPQMLTGQLQTFLARELDGTASRVIF